MSEPNSKERMKRIKDAAEYIERFKEKKEEEKAKREKEDEKLLSRLIHVNLVSDIEMKAHTKEIRTEIDSKFVECLMATGVTRAEAIKLVRVWNAHEGYGYE